MYTSFFIAKNNMKKKKSDVAVITFLIILATMLLYISLSVLGNSESVVENAAKASNTADYTNFTGDEGAVAAKKIFDELDGVKEYEISPVLHIPGGEYYGEDISDKKSNTFIISALGEDRNINKLNIGNHDPQKENSIVLPYSLSVSDGYQIGDIFHMVIGEETYAYEIMGFVEDPLFATPMNITIYRCYISQDNINKILEDSDMAKDLQSSECRVILNDNIDVYDFVDEFVARRGVSEDNFSLGLIYEAMKGGLLMMPGISMGIILIFSVVLIFIAVIIIRFSIKNFIYDNLKNIGILQACGYTSSQLRKAILMEMGLIGVTGYIIGLLLSICGEGIVGNILAMLLGLRYNVAFDVAYGTITFLFVMGVVLLITYISSRTYKKVNVLDALRGGIHTHNFKKNVVPLHKTKLPVGIAIGAKNILGAKFKNMSIFIIIAILSFASCIGFGIYDNFALNKEFMLQLVGAELGTAITSGENIDDMAKEIESWKEVDKVCYYNMFDVIASNGDKSKTITCDGWKNPDLLENVILVEGNFPKYDNEVVISTVVRDFLGAGVGDVIYLQGNAGKIPYIVSGIDQKINNNGQKITLNYDGVERLNNGEEVKTLQIYIYASEGYDYNDIKALMDEKYPGITMVESEKMIEEVLSIVALAMGMICLVFVVITIVVVFLVVFLLIRTKIVSDKKNNGIFKAIGYTTKNLMVQTTMSNLPVIFTGAVAGAVASIFGASPLAKACMSFCGIEKCDVVILPIYLIGTVLGITLVALLVSLAVSARIRKVEPVKMLTEE